MIGVPKHLNTKEDYEYTRLNFPKDIWKKAFEDLTKNTSEWFNVGEVAESVGVTNETHKVVIDKLMDGSFKYYQYELKINPNCKMFRIGYTILEVENILKEE